MTIYKESPIGKKKFDIAVIKKLFRDGATWDHEKGKVKIGGQEEIPLLKNFQAL